jgi:DNA segregation ATPase FtsK/SpoIIIE, S-DNA-T family
MSENVFPIRPLPEADQPAQPATSDAPHGAEVAGPVYEGELLDPVPVDSLITPPPAGPVWERRIDRAPVIPAWVSEPDTRRAAAAWWWDNARHRAKYHAVRLPVYALRLLAASPRGAGRSIAGATRWVADAENGELRRKLGTGDAKAAVRMAEIQRARSQSRAIRLCVAVTAAVGGWVALGYVGAHLLQELLLVAAVAALGWAGRRKDKPLVTRAVTQIKAPRLTSESVTRALVAAVPAISKEKDIDFPAPITRDGPGWRADVDLPPGVTAADVMDRRAELASGLRRQLGCVWPEPDHAQHAGRLVLWVGDQAMNEAKPPPWPLARVGQADLFKPVPFLSDQRGRLVSVLLMYANVLIGSIPGMGKTFALRVLLLAAALDPRAEMRLFELKGTGDLSVFEPVAHHYGSGPDDDTVSRCVQSLREVYESLEQRAKTIASLPRSICPENKVTPQLADRRNLGLHPLVFAVDECQELFSHPEFGKEAETLCTGIIKRGRALGIILLLATQRPDRNSLPTGISANVAVRFCLKVMGHVENDMVLGSGMHRNGVRATMLTARDKGIGWLAGATDEPLIGRSAYIDGPASERIVNRARELREAAGTLSGYAVGERQDTGPDWSLIEDLLTVLPEAEEQAHSDVLCARLAEHRPDRYRGWGPPQLATAIKPFGVATQRNLWAAKAEGGMGNRAGIRRQDVLDAVDRDPE